MAGKLRNIFRLHLQLCGDIHAAFELFDKTYKPVGRGLVALRDIGDAALSCKAREALPAGGAVAAQHIWQYHGVCQAVRRVIFSAESVELHAFEKKDFRVYEGCMPVEVMAKRGPDTIRFGPLKPVGLRDPRTGHRPWAVVQLRKENNAGTLYNLVGFQTNLKWGEQKRVFSMIPGLANAEFVRYGVMHRNTFLDSPRLLDREFRLKSRPHIRFAGQMTGVEGYVESAASGLLAGHHLARELLGLAPLQLPEESMLGALTGHVVNETGDFQPMGANMGILPPLEEPVRDKRLRYLTLAERGVSALEKAIKEAGL